MCARESMSVIRTISCCLILLFLVGCQTTPSVRIVVQPVVPKINDAVPILLRGKIVYDGKEEYFPRTIGLMKTQGDGLTIRYEYADVHERHETRVPIYILGNAQPSGMKTATVFGRLTVLDGENELKTYEAIAVLSTPSERGRTLTEMRIIGLFAVRDSIEGQMYQEKTYLQTLGK